ncbi:ABC transporter substrate-binding protein [Paenibacillus camerounensis]|uniref:ABC transporter substrate-binding protein n=1 Tax=Paenibacillus camerounensis TaxID=1243663 RepID=UPI0005A745E5|nr:ABC transporter substrate-binding protein [Paenibacillus camerounensis]
MLTAALHFLELRCAAKDYETGEPFAVTVDKLAGTWHCTPRYAKQIIRTLNGMAWINWQPGLGRGHSSILTLLADSDAILLQEVKLKMEQSDVDGAMELMNRFGGHTAKEQFRDWLSRRIGFSTQIVQEAEQDTLRFPVYRQIFTLDPGQVYYAFDCHMAGQLFNTLVEYDQTSRRVEPCIAHSWEKSEDNREWIFHLRKGVLFHHGKELGASDVLFSLNRLRLQPEIYEGAWMFQDIDRMEALDAKTVRIRLREPNYLFLRFLCTIPASIIPADMGGYAEADFAVRPVGTGPFRIERHSDGICVLKAFAQHFRGRPQLDRVEILNLSGMEGEDLSEPDWSSAMSSHGDASKAYQKVLKEGSGEWLDLETRFSCCTLLVFNQGTRGPQNHPDFRKALDLLMDRNKMIDELGEDRLHPAFGFRYLPGEQAEMANNTTSPEPAVIRALLAASGYAGEILRLHVNSFHRSDAVWIQEQAGKFGIRVEIQVADRIEDGRNGEPFSQYDARLFGSVLGDDEISEIQMYLQKNYLQPAFDTETSNAVQHKVNAVFREPDGLGRQKVLAELEALLRATNSVLFLIHKKNNTSHHRTVRGVSINAYGWLEFHKIWFQPLNV